MSGLVFSLKTWYNKNVNHICVFCRRPAELPDHNRHKVSEKRGIDMKGTIIAAMIAAAVAASAATVFALKKHTTRDWTRPATVTTCRKADAAAQTRTKMTISVSATHRKKLPTQKRLRRTARKPQRTLPLHPAAVQMVSAPSVRMTMPQTSRHSSICRKLTKTAIPTKPKKRTEFPTLCPA